MDISCQRSELIADIRCDDGDPGTGSVETDCATGRDVATADDEHALAPHVEEKRQPGIVHPPIVSPSPTCRWWRRRMGIEPTSDSDCRSTVLKTAPPTRTNTPPPRNLPTTCQTLWR